MKRKMLLIAVLSVTLILPGVLVIQAQAADLTERLASQGPAAEAGN